MPTTERRHHVEPGHPHSDAYAAPATQAPAWHFRLVCDDPDAVQCREGLLPFWGQRAPAFRQGGEWPSPLPRLEPPCSTACRRTGADPVWGGLRASALCTPCRVCAAVRWASRQRVQQARSTPVASILAIHPDASSFRRTPGTSLGILSFSREAPGFRHGECHSYEQERHTPTEAFQLQFRANGAAWSFFQAQPPSCRKDASYWVIGAKQEATPLPRGRALHADRA